MTIDTNSKTPGDRELLEMAAKAAGWTGWRSKHGYWNMESPNGSARVCCEGWPEYDSETGEKLQAPAFADAISEVNWNPLVDDGDALRLAVKLGLTINPYSEAVFVSRREDEPVILEKFGSDPGTATRRAIVRAAAAIGSAL